MTGETTPLPLIRTKLHRPPVAGDLVHRKELLARLDAGCHLPLTLVSAPAGYGKSTLISHWLETCDLPSAWLSLDENDSDIRLFLTYVLATIRTLFPETGGETENLIRSGELPPVSVLAGFLCNDLDAIERAFILAMDDYHKIRDRAIHDLLEQIFKHFPSTTQLVIMTRRSPPLNLDTLRAKNLLTEIKMDTLRFNRSETAIFLQQAVDHEVDSAVLDKLYERTEGWPVALRLAALAMQKCSDLNAFANEFGGDSRQIQDYLMAEILSQQSPALRDWLMQTAILDRFCAPLCEAVCVTVEKHGLDQLSGAEFFQQLSTKGLLCISLDDRHQWYRYHHLFQQLLRHQMDESLSPRKIAALHQRAAAWFEANDLLEEALHHALNTDQGTAAGQLIIRQRSTITDHEQWHRLDRWLSLLPAQVVDNDLELLILRAWSFDTRGRVAEVFQILDQVEPLANDITPDDKRERLLGEIDALRSMQHYIAADGETSLKLARRALERLPAGYVAERAFATILMAVSLQMTGDLNGAHKIILEALENEACINCSSHGRMLLTLCFMHWMAANLKDLKQTGTTMLTVGIDNDLPETKAYARYFLGIRHYHTNQLIEARETLARVVSERSIPSIANYVRSAQALSLTYQALGEPQKANEVTENIIDWLLKTANTYFLPAMQAFQAELALRQGRLTAAVRWVESFEVSTPQMAYGFFLPEMTAVKVMLRQGTPEALQQAESLLDDFLPFFESTHNISCTLEVLALQALLHAARGDEPAALSSLGRAVELAQPGGFIRLFVDLGTGIAKLLPLLSPDEEGMRYVGLITREFRPVTPEIKSPHAPADTVTRLRENLPDPLSKRELEVLALMFQRFSNKEIGARLYISPFTVKRHTENIYRKLRVGNRREAVAKAQELGMLSSR